MITLPKKPAAPAQPPADKIKLFINDAGKLCSINELGQVTVIGESSTPAPTSYGVTIDYSDISRWREHILPGTYEISFDNVINEWIIVFIGIPPVLEARNIIKITGSTDIENQTVIFDSNTYPGQIALYFDIPPTEPLPDTLGTFYKQPIIQHNLNGTVIISILDQNQFINIDQSAWEIKNYDDLSFEIELKTGFLDRTLVYFIQKIPV